MSIPSQTNIIQDVHLQVVTKSSRTRVFISYSNLEPIELEQWKIDVNVVFVREEANQA